MNGAKSRAKRFAKSVGKKFRLSIGVIPSRLTLFQKEESWLKSTNDSGLSLIF